ncbi:MAG: MotA/TolQ/ExbB proton channel family protein [Planctomycetaceae bacterium]
MIEVSHRRRAACSWAFAAALWGILSCCYPSVGVAQDKKPADGAAKADVAADEPAAEQPKKTQSMLEWIVRTSGWIGAVLLCLSIYFVAKVVSLFLELRFERATPPEIVETCEQLLASKDFAGIFKVVRQDDSFYSAVLESGLKELPLGLTESRDAMERTGDTLVVEMEENISMLAVLGSLGPMIGLLGTLKGMITAFSVIARSGTQLNASEVAGGISEALVLTFEGVGLSVPAIYFFAFFRNRVASISSATMLAADEFIRRAHAVSRGKTKSTGGAPAPTAHTAE